MRDLPNYAHPTPQEQEDVRRWAKAWAAELDAKILADMLVRGETQRLKLVERPKKRG